MTDVHCHLRGGVGYRELVCGEDFCGVHPWASETFTGDMLEQYLIGLRAKLTADRRLGVGEIGLDRLHTREVTSVMREVFERQLALAVELGRAVALHGAKCWGQVVAAVRGAMQSQPKSSAKFLFHGFSRSAGLLPEIREIGGYVSVGPTVLNDHAVNYRELVKAIPDECIVIESDRTVENAATIPPLGEVLAKVASLRGVTVEKMEALTDENAASFMI